MSARFTLPFQDPAGGTEGWRRSAGRCSCGTPVTAWPDSPLPPTRECRRQFPDGAVPGKPRHGAASDPCPACGYQLSHPTQTFCVTCGHYDANLRSGKAP